VEKCGKVWNLSQRLAQPFQRLDDIDRVRKPIRPHLLQLSDLTSSVGSLELNQPKPSVGVQHRVIGNASQSVVFVFPARPAKPPRLGDRLFLEVSLWVSHSFSSFSVKFFASTDISVCINLRACYAQV
jgi:hypothetical protein